jgi:hypothetical protein
MKEFYSMFGTFNMTSMGIVSQPGINVSAQILINETAVNVFVPST